MTENTEKELIEQLTASVRQIAQGHYGDIDTLFELTKEKKYPQHITELAEAFGMMTMQVETREFRLEQNIKDLKEANSAIEVARKEVFDAHEQLKDASLETIYHLSRAAEQKDDDTHSHIQRISYYSAALAKSLGLSQKDIHKILYASPMHDVGKIGIPDMILLKPGRLTESEFNTMKTHTVLGKEILKDSESSLIQAAEIIAETHHEKWDGTGYPRGLSKDDIPLEGRIVAVADVYDALTSKRPYKEPFDHDVAFRMIDELKETHFDPHVTEAFFEIEDEIIEIKNSFS